MTLSEELIRREVFDVSYLLLAADICEDLGCDENANVLRDAAICWYNRRGMYETADMLQRNYCRQTVYRVLE